MSGRAERKEKEFLSGCTMGGVPGEHLRRYVGLELKTRSGNTNLTLSASRW